MTTIGVRNYYVSDSANAFTVFGMNFETLQHEINWCDPLFNSNPQAYWTKMAGLGSDPSVQRWSLNVSVNATATFLVRYHYTTHSLLHLLRH